MLEPLPIPIPVLHLSKSVSGKPALRKLVSREPRGAASPSQPMKNVRLILNVLMVLALTIIAASLGYIVLVMVLLGKVLPLSRQAASWAVGLSHHFSPHRVI